MEFLSRVLEIEGTSFWTSPLLFIFQIFKHLLHPILISSHILHFYPQILSIGCLICCRCSPFCMLNLPFLYEILQDSLMVRFFKYHHHLPLFALEFRFPLSILISIKILKSISVNWFGQTLIYLNFYSCFLINIWFFNILIILL